MQKKSSGDDQSWYKVSFIGYAPKKRQQGCDYFTDVLKENLKKGCPTHIFTSGQLGWRLFGIFFASFYYSEESKRVLFLMSPCSRFRAPTIWDAETYDGVMLFTESVFASSWTFLESFHYQNNYFYGCCNWNK